MLHLSDDRTRSRRWHRPDGGGSAEPASPMCVGTDSHAVIDPFEEVAAIELDERLVSLRRGTHQPGELLAAATTTGYRSLGWHDGGRITVGALADLTSVELTSPRLAGIDPDHAAAAVVFAATAGDVHHVVVGGRVVVADGMHRTIDVVPSSLDRSTGCGHERTVDRHRQHRSADHQRCARSRSVRPANCTTHGW